MMPNDMDPFLTFAEIKNFGPFSISMMILSCVPSSFLNSICQNDAIDEPVKNQNSRKNKPFFNESDIRVFHSLRSTNFMSFEMLSDWQS